MDGLTYFLALVTVISWWSSLRKCWGKSREYLILCFLFILPFALRFAPLLVGLEWRATIRSSIELIAASAMVLWCVICIILLRRVHFFLLTGVAILLCASMFLNNVLYYPVNESIHTRAGVSDYVRENNDPGSLSGVRYYRYVNETFRSLIPSGGSYEECLAEEANS